MTCRDYPLQDGIMVQQYDYASCRFYTLFCYFVIKPMEKKRKFAVYLSAMNGYLKMIRIPVPIVKWREKK